jgi:hypothetical protein
MARPAKGYRTADGKRVPGTTTITGRFKESGALIYWAWDLGMQGINYRDARDAAAGAGTLAHEMIDARIHGREFVPTEDHPADMVRLATAAFDNFKRWADGIGMVVTHTEQPLVSESFRFGGTFDALVQVAGVPALLDFKTGKGTSCYVDTLYQLGAYKVLSRECLDIDPQEAHVLKLSREQAAFAHYCFGAEVLDRGADMFLQMRSMYDLDKQMKKVVS